MHVRNVAECILVCSLGTTTLLLLCNSSVTDQSRSAFGTPAD
jgi:hypothetical protein